MASINLDGFGYNESTDKSGNYTFATTDSGVVLNVTDTATITLPAVGAGASGLVCIVRVGAENKTVTISPNSADKIVGNGFTAADDKDAIATSQPAGSYIVLQSANEATTDSAWIVTRVLGTWTRQA